MSSDSAALFQPFPMLSGRRAQVWRHQPAYLRPRHFHAEPELNVVLRGSATLAVGSNRTTLGAGQLVLFMPGQDHALRSASADLDLRVLALRPELAARLPGSLSSTASGAAVPASLVCSLAERLEGIEHVADAQVVERHLLEWFAELAALAAKPSVQSRRAAELLGLEPSLTCAEVAERIRVPTSELSRSFRRGLGLNLVDYRARLRLMQFVKLVDDGHSATSAALSADFGSYAQCFRVFQRALGCSPQRYFAGARRAIDELVVAPPR